MTSTMLEPFDTQMLDYPTDIDVPMQSEMWMPYESSMDTDARFDPDESLADADFDVEVDMDSYNPPLQNPEYEMVDDGTAAEQEFMVDVEVLDGSLPESNADSEHHDVQPSPVPITDLTLELPAEPTLIAPPLESHPSFHATLSQGSELLLQSHSETPQLTQDVAIPSFEQITESLLENAPVTPLPIDDTLDAVFGDSLLHAPSELPVEDSFSRENYEITLEVHSEEVEESLYEGFQSHEDGTAVAGETNTEEAAVISDETAIVHEEPVSVSDPIAAAAGAEAGADTGANDILKDPHEISDGVYIEPPQAVLLSFPDFDHPDVCLFNQPSVASSSSQQEQQEYSLLLEHRPTLYYESLSAVFIALREDECLSGVIDLSTAELVLDAHDLQLVISEDNKYASEVTLHELNIIHDVSEISGPLRLRLHTITPRFILRYRQLQDQVARLQLGSDETFYTADEENKQNQSEETRDVNEESVQEQQYEETEEEQHDEAEHDQEGIPGVEDEPYVEDSEQRSEEAPTEPLIQSESIEYSEERPEDHAQDQPDEQKRNEDQSAAEEPTFTTHDEYENDADGDYEYYGEAAEEGEDVTTDAVQDPISSLVTPRPLEVALPPESKVEEHIGKNGVSPPSADTLATAAVISENDVPSSELEKEYANSEEDYQLLTATEGLDNKSTDDSRDRVQETYDYLNNDEEWGDADAEGDPDTTWEELDPEAETASNESSVTLASRTSKRSIDEVEAADGDLNDPSSPQSSPSSKRVRVD
ncbi:hypothetical protein IW261DRAFT_1461894 [Armillaria novae-zelandiae]|uniref:Uncharacterized protein n=1 Tax=Armillaria novae-zelandiae TaxID=153914 RepID=A0AA39PH53_9AGAR|nr:hypothetical protein IW261DRAFT_1461894 [Armillaria novae-zelandiae]